LFSALDRLGRGEERLAREGLEMETGKGAVLEINGDLGDSGGESGYSWVDYL